MDPNHLGDPSEKNFWMDGHEVWWREERSPVLIWFMTKYLKSDQTFPSASEMLLGVFTSSNVTNNYDKMYTMFLAIL